MVSFREASVEEPAAHSLLAEYFELRSATFPAGSGSYHTAFPSPTDFVPPRGVFLVMQDAEHASSNTEGMSGAALAAVGCGGIRLLEHAAGVTRFEVKHLYVQPSRRGRGSGRTLLDELEAHARAFGASELVLDTNASLTAAGGLYRSSGYTEIAPYNSNPNATHWFAKNLTTELE